jgi:hypothetical protein
VFGDVAHGSWLVVDSVKDWINVRDSSSHAQSFNSQHLPREAAQMIG